VSEISLPAGRLSPGSGTNEADIRRHSSTALTTSPRSTDDSIGDVHSHTSPPLHHSSSRATPVSLLSASDNILLHNSPLIPGPSGARGRCRISPPRFLAECRKRRLNQGSFVSAVCLAVCFL